MPCLLGCLALSAPRFVLFLVWLFSSFLGRAYASTLWPLLGFLFLPMTTLVYACAINWHGGVGGIYVILLPLALLYDFGSSGMGYRQREEIPGPWPRRGVGGAKEVKVKSVRDIEP